MPADEGRRISPEVVALGESSAGQGSLCLTPADVVAHNTLGKAANALAEARIEELEGLLEAPKSPRESFGLF